MANKKVYDKQMEELRNLVNMIVAGPSSPEDIATNFTTFKIGNLPVFIIPKGSAKHISVEGNSITITF
jgi:hypothetical protein